MLGTILGQHRVTARLGAGGMGEVYRATDTRLGRDVAVKLLPAELAQDPERLARFEREAKLLASLNHPNVAHVYGFENATLPDGSTTHFLAMELVEGEDLAERLKRGPIPIDDALAIARQVAEALEEAHEKGIVHRDLKPANVKQTPDGRVKVLDFGLAKAYAGDAASGASADLSQSPTLAHTGTEAGVILGTAAYMSPEQARGRSVDKRADVWAFGVLVYEMLTAHKLFAGETVSDTLAAVLRSDPDWSRLPESTPPTVRRLLRRCLERDPKRRLRDIGEARIALDPASDESEALAEGAAVGHRGGVSRPVVAGALVVAAALCAFLSWRLWRLPPAGPPPAVTELSVWVDRLGDVALSPDGQRLAYRDGSKTFVRDLADRVPRELLDDPEARPGFWSPDGSELAVVIGERLWRVRVEGGERSPICDLPRPASATRAEILAGIWLPDDTLRLAAWRGGIYRVPAGGGKPDVVVPIDPKSEVDFHFLQLMPDARSLLIRAHCQDEPGGRGDLEALSAVLEVRRDGVRRVVALPAPLDAIGTAGYAHGFLLTTSGTSSDRSLWAAPFDVDAGAVTGEPSLLVPRVAWASVARDGTLAYVAQRDEPSVVVRLDRTGAERSRLGQPQPEKVARPALSPEGSRLAFVREGRELWLLDIARHTTTRVVREEQSVEDPQWSPDGRALYYTLDGQNLFRRIAAGPGAVPETVLDGIYRAFLTPDGRGALALVGTGFRQSETDGLYWVPFTEAGRPGERRRLLEDRSSYGLLSPDGRAVAYSSSATGRREAYLSTFPDTDQKIQLSSNGGGTPRWSPDGESVFYVADGALVEVEVGLDGAGRLTASPARKLFDLAPVGVLSDGGWNVTPDGRGFLFVKSLETDTRSEIVVRRNALAAMTGRRGR